MLIQDSAVGFIKSCQMIKEKIKIQFKFDEQFLSLFDWVLCLNVMLSGMCFPAPPSVIPNIISAYESEMQINSSLKKKKKLM